MATTAAAILARMRAVLEQTAPRVHADVPFVVFVADVVANFRAAAAANPSAMFRKFFVRELGDIGEPIASDSEVELVRVDFELLIAYPADSRTGDDGAIDRDAASRSDADQVRELMGIYGAENFTAPHVDATWIREGARATRETVGAVEFRVFTLRMQFWRAVGA